MKDNLIAK